MKLSSVSHVLSIKKEAGKWTAKEDFALRLLAGTMSYRQIAPQLGRTYYSVMRRGTALKLRVSQEAAAELAMSRLAEQQRKEALLLADEESLAEFLPECSEPPVLPHVAGSEYFRLKKREYRAK